MDPEDEGSTLQNISKYLSVNSVYHPRRLEILISTTATTSHLTLSTQHTSSSAANSCSASQYILFSVENSQMNPVQQTHCYLNSSKMGSSHCCVAGTCALHGEPNSQSTKHAVSNEYKVELNDLITTVRPLNMVYTGNVTEKCHVWFNLCSIHIFAVSP